jgi:two-component system CheB/CheR fusion protein
VGFLEGGGELGALMRRHDWSATPLGPTERWPQSLRTTVAILLRSPVPIVLLWGRDGVMLYNDAYSVFAGGRHPRLLGSKVLEGWPEVASFNANVMKAGLAGGTLAYKDQHLVLYRNGVAEDVWMNLDYSPVPGDDGKPAGVLAIVVETTERNIAERGLRESEERLRLALDAGKMGTWEWHMQENRVIWSPALQELHGLAPGTFDGTFEAYQRDIHPEDREHVLGSVRRTLEHGEDHRIEYRIVRPDGSLRWVEGRGKLVRDAQRRPQRMIGVCADITERKQAEQALREADRRKDEFLATLSHELRNPLAPLRNALQFLELSLGGDERVEPLRQMMERQVGHLVRLVDDLLEMSRISRGALELRRSRVAVSDMVRNALETSQPLLRAARHQLSVALPGEPLWVDGDPVRLAQILANLLNNAAKYTPPGGRIGVAARKREGCVEVAVRDNGPGIAPEALPRLFEMFARGGGPDRGGQGGLGIGLALSRRLAEMHGGSLGAKSDGLGRGAEFTLTLALAAAPQPGTSSAAPAAARLPGRRILVVDDNRDAAESLSMVLKFLGADVQVANDGRQALDAFQSYQPAVVFLDIGMPGMDGYEVARRMRAAQNGERPALVALTGWGQEADRQRSRDAGFDHHLVKPADLGVLQALLASLGEQARH